MFNSFICGMINASELAKSHFYYRYGLTPISKRESQDDSIMFTYRYGSLILLVEVHPDEEIAIVIHDKKQILYCADVDCCNWNDKEIDVFLKKRKDK